jgi:beta-lactamase regulating signal transducer with metallopeptidase domain
MHTALNWLWQGCVVAVALVAMLRLLDRAKANVRYLVCWAAQLLVLALPLAALLGWSDGEPAPLPRVPVGPVLSVPDAWWTSGVVMLALWLAWMSTGAIRFVRAMVALRRARTQSRPFPSQVESRLDHWRQIREWERRPRLVLSESVAAAAVLGCGRPLIAVAPSLVATLDVDELDHVLVHEWAHVRRRDDLVNVLQIAVRIVAGWHPAVWWIDRRLQLEREIACDETTVAVTGAPKSYAACLVKLATLRGATQAALAAPAVLAASGLRARVTRIVSRHAFLAPRWSVAFALAIAGALTLVAGAVAQTRLVEPAVWVFPYESMRLVGVRVERPAPIAVPSTLLEAEPARVTRLSTVVRPAMPTAIDQGRMPDRVATTTAAEPRAPIPAPSTVELPAPQAQIETPASAEPQVRSAAAPVDPERSPWAGAADGGKTIGRKSKEAGVATAGVFTRFARRVAGSF